MANVTITFPAANPVPLNGYRFGYRLANSGAAYTYVNTSTNSVTVNDLEASKSYEYIIQSSCASNQFSAGRIGNFCTCPDNFTKDSFGNCIQRIDLPADIVANNYCLAPSQQSVYTQFFTRVYKPGFSQSSISMFNAPAEDVAVVLSTPDIWVNQTSSVTGGPMNAAAVWADSDCNGIRNGLSPGQQITVAYGQNNTGIERTVYVGIASDNIFTLKVNGVEVAKTTAVSASENFKIWHIFPVILKQGFNLFNAIGTGDGTQNDAIGMVIYDDTLQNLISASSQQMPNVMFTTASLICTPEKAVDGSCSKINLATCQDGYNLDTSNGTGNYRCVKINLVPCG